MRILPLLVAGLAVHTSSTFRKQFPYLLVSSVGISVIVAMVERDELAIRPQITAEPGRRRQRTTASASRGTL
jgi:hypothetical protein